ncbi:MAG: hypothetical protein CVV53_00365 [Spirochaetae bacterium HGW-Spirochaetae-9]|nr:MAG: hypothetical protein CVV53_00365 [Spirochaetae bacterium HGW-Spirochaetae-9]
MKSGMKSALMIGALAIASCVGPRPLGAQNAAELFFPGDKEYENRLLGAIREGRVPDTNAFPLFGQEVPSGGVLPSRSGLSASFSTPSLYYDSPATQDDLASNLLDEPSTTPRAFPEIQHFLRAVPDPVNLEFRLYPSDSIAFKIDLFFNYRRDRIAGQDSTFQWSLDEWLGNLVGAAEFPRKAYFAWAGEGYGVALGRFPSGTGWGKLTGSIMNPRASWYDQARFYLDSGSLRFTAMLATSSAQLSTAEREMQFRRKPDGSSFWDSLNDHDSAAADLALKLATWHQVEWKPASWLSLAFTEMSVIGGRSPSLAFVLPSAIWHSAYAAGYSNVGAALSAAAVPNPGLLVSGEFFIDDVRSTDEPAYSKPAAFAWNGTARWTREFSEDLALETGLEYQHVDRWTYVRWNPYLSMYQRQTLTGGRRSLDQSLGAPWGPDYDSVGAYANLDLKNGASLELSYEFIRKGPIYQGMAAKITESSEDLTGDEDTNDTLWVPVFYDYDKYAGEGALAAILARPDEYRHLVSLSGSLPLRPGIDLKLASTFGLYQNFGNTSSATETALLIYLGLVAHFE